MKNLFVHPLKGNAFELFKAFNRVESVSTICPFEKPKRFNLLLYRILFKLNIPMDIYRYNTVLRNMDLSSFDSVFIVK